MRQNPNPTFHNTFVGSGAGVTVHARPHTHDTFANRLQPPNTTRL